METAKQQCLVGNREIQLDLYRKIYLNFNHLLLFIWRKQMKDKSKNKDSKIRWIITVFALTFILSLFFNYISTGAIANLETIPAVIVLILVILLGILFDIIGVAVTVADETEFHAMASKKIRGSKKAIKLIRNSARVASICADVIGDISGVLSGAISTLIALKITSSYNLEFNVQIILSALVAAIIVGGKALGKEWSQKHSTKIVSVFSKILSIFSK